MLLRLRPSLTTPACTPASTRGAMAALIIALAVLATTGRRDALGQGAPTGLSPEEAIIALAPYRVATADLPVGYSPGTPAADVPSVNAFENTAGSDRDPHADLTTELRLFGIVGMVQGVRIPQSRNVPDASALVEAHLFSDPGAAAAFAATKLRASSDADPGATLGEGATAQRLTSTPRGSAAQLVYYEIRWKRGLVAFEVMTNAPPGQDTLIDAQQIASAFDKKAAGVPAPLLTSPTVTPPATEDQRIDAMARLASVTIDAADAPPDFGNTSLSIAHPAGFVIASQNPRAALQRIDQRWKRIISFSQTFDPTRGNPPPELALRIRLDADAQAAANDLNDNFQADPAPPQGITETAVSPPVMFGDASLAVVTKGTFSDNTPFQSELIGWTHGPLVLSASLINSPGAISQDQLVAFTKQVEAAFQASPLATTSTSPTAPTAGTIIYPAGWDLVSGPPGTDFSAAQGLLYTIQPGDSRYQSTSPGGGTKSGWGYWALFASDTAVRLPAGSTTPATVTAPAGQFFMIGNPSGSRPATVTGADAVLTYDPIQGYQQATTLPPGRGAWVFSANGGTIRVTPMAPTMRGSELTHSAGDITSLALRSGQHYAGAGRALVGDAAARADTVRETLMRGAAGPPER